MAQIEVVNLEKLSSAQGYKMPANTPGAVSPDNITHAQLRKSPFADGNLVAQGTAVSGENSTFQFSVADGDADELLKLYVSTDGSTYTERKTYGGANGKNPFGSVDLSTYVTTNTTQNITATKTLASNANLVIGSGSDITVQSGGDITLADAPSVSTDAVNKAYVDSNTFKSCVFWIDALSIDNTTVALSYRRIFNNTGVTPTLAYGNNSLGEAGLVVTFNRTSSAWDIVSSHFSNNDEFASIPAGFMYIDSTITQSTAATSTVLTYGTDFTGASQSVTQHYYDMLTADTWGRTGSNENKFLVTGVTGISLSGIPNADSRKNARIELRFYD